MNTTRIVPIAFLLLVTVTACAPSYLGKTVDYNEPGMCRVGETPTACRISLQHFDFTFDVESMAGGDYRIAGKAMMTLPSRNHYRIYSGTFSFLLLSEGKVIGSASVAPRGSLDGSIPFRRRFQTQEKVDAIRVTYDLELTRRIWEEDGDYDTNTIQSRLH